jgi:uncharacterized 2Fe-2S/4Fe-4S cluster protein (DUF4445 family)
MPLITFKPSGRTIEVPAGTELLRAARDAGIRIDSLCGGKGACGKCIVKIISGYADSKSLGKLSAVSVAEGYVLACRTKILESDITVEIPEQIGRSGGKFTDAAEDKTLVRQELFPERWEYDPLTVKWRVNVPQPRHEDGLSDLDRLTRQLQFEWGKKDFLYPLSVIRVLADTLRAENGLVTATIIREKERYSVIRLEPGDTTVNHHGIAVDVGTTTVAVQLVSLHLAEIVGTKKDYNAQVECGLDVISRINYARKPGHLDELRRKVLDTINSLTRQICDDHNINPETISDAVISGNTTMVHLLLGLNPEYIRIEPYTPTLLKTPYLSAEEVGIAINPNSWVYISPSVGSYVGGDITAGFLCTDLAADNEEISLFIDIGTNGEIVIGNNNFMMTCACSAGPAFEGGGIDCGMRAAIGAIEKVAVEPVTGICKYWTIGNVKPMGICGSGMISLLADLLLTGWIDAAGKFTRKKKSEAIKVDGRNASYIMVSAKQSATGREITISESDIENIIRAKAAIYSACALMLNQVGMSFNDLSSIYIAGGFGRFLDLEKAMIIGLIPDLPMEKFHYIGNSSLTGSYMILISREFRKKQLDLCKKMTYIELNTEPGYMNQYTGAMFLPHTNQKLFPTVKTKLDQMRQKQR